MSGANWSLSVLHVIRPAQMVPHFGGSDLEVAQLFLTWVQNPIGKIWWIYSQKIYTLYFRPEKVLSIVFLRNVGPRFASWQDTSLRKCLLPLYTGSPHWLHWDLPNPIVKMSLQSIHHFLEPWEDLLSQCLSIWGQSLIHGFIITALFCFRVWGRALDADGSQPWELV